MHSVTLVWMNRLILKVFSCLNSLTFNTNTNLLGVEEDLRQQYIEQEANNRRAEVKEMNRKMRKVMDRWLGLSMEEVFLEWTLVWKAVKARISKDQRIKNKSMRIENEENIAYFELAKKEVRINIVLFLTTVTSMVIKKSHVIESIESY